jgi:hypothetical protein
VGALQDDCAPAAPGDFFRRRQYEKVLSAEKDMPVFFIFSLQKD